MVALIAPYTTEDLLRNTKQQQQQLKQQTHIQRTRHSTLEQRSTETRPMNTAKHLHAE